MKGYPPSRSDPDEGENPPSTAALVAQAHANREGEAYPTPERLLANLPIVLRALCDHVLTGHADAYEVARALASLIEVIEMSTAAHTHAGPRQTH